MYNDANQTCCEFIGAAAVLATGIGLTGPAACAP